MLLAAEEDEPPAPQHRDCLQLLRHCLALHKAPPVGPGSAHVMPLTTLHLVFLHVSTNYRLYTLYITRRQRAIRRVWFCSIRRACLLPKCRWARAQRLWACP